MNKVTQLSSRAPQPAPPQQPGFRVLEWRPYAKNTLVGFFSMEMPSGLLIHGLTLYQKNLVRWVGLPAKEFGKEDGSRGWTPILEIRDREAYRKFQQLTLEAIDVYMRSGER